MLRINRNFMHSRRLTVYSFLAAFCLITPVSLIAKANADGNNTDGYTGKYSNQQFGFELTLPAGWKGFENPGINSTTFHANPYNGIDAQPASLHIIVDAFNQLEMSTCLEETHTYTSSIVTVNGMPAVKCVFNFNQFETYYFKNSEHNYMIELDATHYIAYSDTPSFDAYMNQMRSILGTLKIDNAVDPQSESDSASLTSHVERLHLPDKDIDIAFDSSSDISAVNFDESGKRLQFRVSGTEGTLGTTVLHIGSLLKGPYVVTFDGRPITNFTTSNDGTITLRYHHSSHTISVSGAEVVPEFPIPVLGAIASVIGIIAIIGRMKLFNRL